MNGPQLTWIAGAVTVLAAPPAPAQKAPKAAATLEARVQEALARARPMLLKRLRRAHGGELALLCLAAVHDDVQPDDKVFDAALGRLAKARLARTYDLALRLMVAAECPAFPHRKAVAARDHARLLDHITRKGAFGYHKDDNRWDLSNTQYAVLGLRAGVSLQAVVKAEDWERVLRTTITAQVADHGFAYTTHHGKATASMTAAGIAVLQVCASHLDEKVLGKLDVAGRLERAWKWLVDHKGAVGTKLTPNCFYFHYGLERAGILSDVTELDGKDWYRAGAEMFLRTQLPNGGWHSQPDIVLGKGDDGADSVSTAFAVLFLRRKFQKTLQQAPITPGGGIPVHLLGDRATPQQVQDAIDGAVRRGVEAMPQILRALRDPMDVRRRAAAKAMIRIAGEDFGYNPHAGADRNRDALKAAERWFFRARKDAAGGSGVPKK